MRSRCSQDQDCINHADEVGAQNDASLILEVGILTDRKTARFLIRIPPIVRLLVTSLADEIAQVELDCGILTHCTAREVDLSQLIQK
jgi:hypothetical protein